MSPQKLQKRLSILSNYQATASLLDRGLKWIRQIAHLLESEGSTNQAAQELLNYLAQLKEESFNTSDIASDSSTLISQWLEHFQKITISFSSKLFSYLQQPLLPKTNNDLEIFIGQIKKSRRQITGRKNTQAFILREGAAVAILFGLPQDINWLESFATVGIDNFRTSLTALRRSERRSKCWQIRRDLKTYLSSLEQQWLHS